MAKRYEVAAAQIVVKVPGAAGGEAYLRRGRLVPKTVEKAEVERLLELGLIAESDVVEEAIAEATTTGSTDAGARAQASGSDDGIEVPEGAPTKSWTHKQIDKWGSLLTPPVTFSEGLSIDKKLEAIAAAKQP